MADVELALMEFLDDLGHTVTSTPPDVEHRPAVIRIRRIGGPGNRDTDFPRVSIQHFAKPTQAKPRAHFDLAELVEERMLDKTPAFVNGQGICLDEVEKDSGPVELVYPNQSVRVTETIYRLTTRR